MSSRKDVARAAGVSETTVTNILNRKKPATKEVEERVKAAAKQLNYHPNVIAQGLRTKNSRQIGVFISEIGNPYFVEMLHGIEIEAANLGYVTTIILITENIEKKYSDIISRGFAGIINLSNIPYTVTLMKELYDNGTALINFDKGYSTTVSHDLAPSMHELVRRAYELGHRKAAYIVGYPDFPTAKRDSRVTAYLEETEKLGFLRKDLIYGNFPVCSSTESGYDGANKVFSGGSDVTALFCINDMCALGAMSALKEHHLRVPDDVSVIGCDNISMSKFFIPPLTTMETFGFKRGSEMVKAVVRRIDGEDCEDLLLPCEPVWRESLTSVKKED